MIWVVCLIISDHVKCSPSVLWFPGQPRCEVESVTGWIHFIVREHKRLYLINNHAYVRQEGEEVSALSHIPTATVKSAPSHPAANSCFALSITLLINPNRKTFQVATFLFSFMQQITIYLCRWLPYIWACEPQCPDTEWN